MVSIKSIANSAISGLNHLRPGITNKIQKPILTSGDAPKLLCKQLLEPDIFVKTTPKIKNKKVRFYDTIDSFDKLYALKKAYWDGDCSEEEKSDLLKLLNGSFEAYKKRKPLPEDMRVYRGVRPIKGDFYSEKFIDSLKNVKIGDKMPLAPFETHVSKFRSIALDYAEVLFDIELPKGSRVINGWNPSRFSKVLPPMAQMDVIGVEDVIGGKNKYLKRIIQCRHVPSELEPLSEFPVFSSLKTS